MRKNIILTITFILVVLTLFGCKKKEKKEPPTWQETTTNPTIAETDNISDNTNQNTKRQFHNLFVTIPLGFSASETIIGNLDALSLTNTYGNKALILYDEVPAMITSNDTFNNNINKLFEDVTNASSVISNPAMPMSLINGEALGIKYKMTDGSDVYIIGRYSENELYAVATQNCKDNDTAIILSDILKKYGDTDNYIDADINILLSNNPSMTTNGLIQESSSEQIENPTEPIPETNENERTLSLSGYYKDIESGKYIVYGAESLCLITVYDKTNSWVEGSERLYIGPPEETSLQEIKITIPDGGYLYVSQPCKIKPVS